MGLRVLGLGCGARVWGLGSRVYRLGFRISGFEFRVIGSLVLNFAELLGASLCKSVVLSECYSQTCPQPHAESMRLSPSWHCQNTIDGGSFDKM